VKLYVWASPYKVWYGGSLLYVVAESLEDALRIAASSPVYYYGYSKKAVGGPSLKLGEPTRVVDLPCGEFYQWEE
jgi:hypothetical protein